MNKVLLEKIKNLTTGYSVVLYKNKKYGVTRSDFNEGKSFKVYAEELGGTDFISLNYYITSTKNYLKPCEMPDEKVIDFLNNYKIINTMTDVKFINKRFDPEVTPFLALAKQMAEAFGYTADLKTDKILAQLLRLRVAQKNECAYCVILHADFAREIKIPASKVDNISSWWNSDLFKDKEKAALQYCDVLTEGTNKNFQATHDALAQFFNEVEIAEIAAIVINMNVWTRLKLAQGETPVKK